MLTTPPLKHEKFQFLPSTQVVTQPIKINFSARSTMGQIYHDLENIRPQLFRLTAETEDDNDELMLILRLTDEVTRIINTCKEKYPQVIAR